MKLTIQDIDYIAGLARLALFDSEKKLYAEQMSAVLQYVEMLNGVDTEGVEETTQVTGLEDVFREDEAIACDEETRKKILSQFPEEQRGLLRVKGVFVEE